MTIDKLKKKSPPDIEELIKRTPQDFPLNSIWMSRNKKIYIIYEGEDNVHRHDKYPIYIKEFFGKNNLLPLTINPCGLFNLLAMENLCDIEPHDFDLIFRIYENDYPEYFL